MSSSSSAAPADTHTGRPHQSATQDDPQTDRQQEPANFRRWSRNLSANRKRELDRLNLIEKRRQFLELKQQNDLFDQMSFTVNNLMIGQRDAGERRRRPVGGGEQRQSDKWPHVAGGGERNARQLDESNNNDSSNLAAASANSASNESTNSNNNNNNNEFASPPAANLATHRQPKSPQVNSSGNNNNNKSLDNQTTTISQAKVNANPSVGSLTLSALSSSPPSPSSSSSSSSSSSPSSSSCSSDGFTPKSAQQRQVAKVKAAKAGPLATSSNLPPATSRPDASQESLAAGQQPVISINGRQLIHFVTCPVPKNKRVLCLIVRDKVSKLNRSYFYPTYYLFIQTIVDIDAASADKAAHLSGSSPTLSQLAEADNDSTLNSFSASSSISADMMFIGGLEQPRRPAGQSAQGGHPQQQVAANQLAHTTGTSYSDNEIYSANDDDDEGGDKDGDDYSSRVSPNYLSSKRAAASGAKAALVFPNVSPDSPDDKTGGNAELARRRRPAGGLLKSLRGRAKQQATLSVASSLERKESDDDAGDGQKDADEGDDNDHHEGDESTLDGGDKSDGFGQGRRHRQQVAGSTRRHQLISNEQPRAAASAMMDLFENDKNPFTGTYGVLLAGRRRKKAKTYLIGPNEFGFARKNSICKLKSNVLGTQFNAIRLNHAENNDRCTIASISYETNVLGFKGPRKMRVLLPAKDKTMREQREQQVAFKHNLAEMHKKQPSSVIQLKNMTPSWNVESQSYVLNFHGRVTQASVKNFQLIESEDHLDNLSANNNNLKRAQHKEWPPEDASPAKQANVATFWAPSTSGDQPARPGGSLAGAQYNSSIVMQFGRISTHEFTCDVSHPLSILQAFSIALSSFDSKLACE